MLVIFNDSNKLAECFKAITANREQYVSAITAEWLDEYSWELQGDKLIAAHDELYAKGRR